MSRQLYDLSGADERLRFSPYCWRVKMALKHKGLEFDTVPWHFHQKEVLAFSGQQPLEAAKVPILVEPDGQAVCDSMRILEFLDRKFPEQPLLGDAQARARLEFIRYWSEAVMSPAVMQAIMGDLFAILDPADQPYFRSTREARLGKSLEDFHDPEAGLKKVAQALVPLHHVLRHADFIDGAAPAAADYVAFGVFMWGRVVSATPLVEASDAPVHNWLQRMLGLHDGYAASSARVGG